MPVHHVITQQWKKLHFDRTKKALGLIIINKLPHGNQKKKRKKKE